jgi:general secretion pathway protein D
MITNIKTPQFLLLLFLSGCAGMPHHRDGLHLLKEGKTEEGLAALAKAVSEEPTNAEYRTDYLTRRESYVDQLLASAQAQRQSGNFAEAEEHYKHVLAIAAANVKARTGLDELVRDRRHKDIYESAQEAFKSGDSDKAASILHPLLVESPDYTVAQGLMREIEELRSRRQTAEPVLSGSSLKPINLEFRDANVRTAFEVIARSTGINFILDKDVRPDLRTTVFLRGAVVEDAIDLILQTCQLQKKVLNSNTVLIYPNTPEKIKDYQELVMRAFYLQNTDVKQVQNTLKTLLKAKDLVVDEKLNLLIMRDTPEAIRLAEKLVAMHDMPEPEVMLELEVLEVQRDRLTNLGIQWPGQLTLAPLTVGSGSLTLNDLQHLNSKKLGANISKTVINVQRDITETNILANPRIRVKNRETAKIMIGDKVPVVTTTTTATGLVSDSVQYLDVGLKVDIQPDIFLQDEVAIKVGLEVSSIVKEITSLNGTLSYQVGSRSASTVLRLKDGETQILAGLISDQERATGSGVPGLGDLPILGRLFSSQQNTRNKTEIVLSITPRLVRNIARPVAMAGEFWSGTESTLRTKPLTLQPVLPKEIAAQSPLGGVATKEENISNRPAAPRESAKSISLDWQGPHQVKVGDTIKLELKLKADGGVRSLPFQAAFDTTAFQVVQIEEGGFFKQDNGATSFSSNVDAVGGKLFVSVIRSNVEGVSGEGAVAVVTLRALAAKPQTTIKMLAASPVVQSDKPPAIILPPPHEVAISQ